MKKGIFTKILYLVAILLLATQDIFADVSNPPQTIPVPPTQEAASVKSIFCDEYTDITSIKGFSGRGSATATVKSVMGNDMIYFDQGLGGWSFVELGTTINLDDCEALCFDIYVVKTGFTLKVYFGQGASVTIPTPLVEGWNKIEIKLDDYRNLPAGKIPDLTQISKIGFINGGGYDRTVYIDNIYAYGDLGGDNPSVDPNAPTVAAPTPKHKDTDVKSIFSDAYDNITNLILNNPGSPAAEMAVVTPFEGDNMLRFNLLNWALVKFDPTLNLDGMDYLHFDVWAESTRTIKLGLGNWSSQANTDALTLNAGWTSFDIPMSVFKSADLTNIIVSKIFSGNGFAITRLYFDNIYTYKGDPVGTPIIYIEPAPEPILAPKTVKSVFTDKYNNIANLEEGGTVGLTDFDLVYRLTEADKVLRICSLEEMTLHTTATLDFSDMENIHFSMYCDGEGGSGTLEIGFQAQGSETAYYSSLFPVLKTDEWNYVNIPVHELKEAGLDCSKIDKILFRGSGNIYIDNIFAFKGDYAMGLGEEGTISVDWNLASADDVLPDKEKAYLGVNLAQGSGGTVHGVFNTNYSYPTFKDLHYFKSKGVRLIRFPFRWERVQHEVNGPLDMELDMKKIKEVIAEAERIGMYVMLDMHDYCRRNVDGVTCKISDSGKLTKEHLADVWEKIAVECQMYKNIWGYDIMNEPYGLDKGVWYSTAQAVIDAIRTVDMQTPIVIEGESYASSSTWPSTGGGLIGLNDPANNLIFQAHCYFDKDKSGHYNLGDFDKEVSDPQQHIKRLQPFVEWLKEHNQRGILGEFGVPGNDVRWLNLLDEVIAYLKENRVAATYWVAGGWSSNDKVSIHPLKNYTVERAQMRIFEKYTKDYDNTSSGTGCILHNESGDLEIYSDVTADHVYVKADKAMKSIALFTMSGQCIKKESIGSSEARIVTDGLVPGVYLIRILIENGSVRNFKFVKY